jgi:hypothetical protein
VDQVGIGILIGVAVVVLGAVGGVLWRRAARAREERHPLRWSVERVVGDKWSLAFSGALPDDASEVEGPGNVGRDVYAWLVARGAVDVDETRLRLRVRGLAGETVVIHNIRAVVEHGPPYSGTLVHCPTAGANSATLLVFDLDDSDPQAWEWKEDGSRTRVGNSPFFNGNTVTLTREEVHDFIIIGHAGTLLARWHIELDLEIGAHREVVVVDDSSVPFTTSGRPAGGYGSSLHWAWYDGQRFLPPPTHD